MDDNIINQLNILVGRNPLSLENNIYLVRIPYYEFNNIDYIINKKII